MDDWNYTIKNQMTFVNNPMMRAVAETLHTTGF